MFESDLPTDVETPPPAVDACDAAGPVTALTSSEPPFDYERIDALTETALQLACLENAVRLQRLKVLRELEEAGAWIADGQLCMANWVALQFDLSRNQARELVKVAEKIGELPQLAAAYGEGRLSWDRLVPLCELATPDTDAEWAVEGTGWSPESLCRLAASRRLTNEQAKDVHEQRGVRVRPHRSGGTELRVVLENSDAAAVVTELDRIREQEAVRDPDTERYPTVSQQRADALVSLAHRGLGADAHHDRATVVLHADASVVCDGNDDGHARLPDGTPVATETVRRLACDGRIEWAIDGPDGVTLGVGRATRSWPPWVARIIVDRDGGRCRFGRCPNRIHHIHHIAEWVADRGRTDTRNGAGLCWTHHHLVHEGRWRIEGNADHTLTFVSPDGMRRIESPVRRLSPQAKQWLQEVLPTCDDGPHFRTAPSAGRFAR